MSVSEEFRLLVLDQLSSVAEVTTRRMFGGLGIYAEGLFFALVDDDVLYFKVDDETRPDFEAAGSRAFKPFGEDGGEMGYWNVPADVLEDTDALAIWLRKALGVAARAKRRKSGGSRRTKAL